MGLSLVVPARLESTRMKKKMLRADTGTPLLAHTLQNLQKMDLYMVNNWIVAVDDIQTLQQCRKHVDGRWQFIVTSKKHPNGTSRIEEVSRVIREQYGVFLNCQGDEPELRQEVIEALLEAYSRVPCCDMATVACEFRSWDEANSPDVVKVQVQNTKKQKDFTALDFYREPPPWLEYSGTKAFHEHRMMRHVGLYMYSGRFLNWFVNQEPTKNEITRSLEQMRAVDNNARIHVAEIPTDMVPHGIDTEKDYQEFVNRCQTNQSIH